MPVLSKIRPVKCWDFANRRRFPVRFPRFTVIVPDFQRNNTQEGDYQKLVKKSLLSEFLTMVKATSSRTNLDWDTNSQTIDIKQYLPRS